VFQSQRQSPDSTSCGARSGPPKIPIDPNGNLTARTEGSDTWGYEWNANNELVRVTKNSVEQARFSYDPAGRRVEQTAGGVTAVYAYDGLDVLREVRGGTTLKYVDDLDIDSPLAIENGSGTSYVHRDGLGSIVKWTNAAGTVSLTRQYDPWGNLEAGADEPGYALTGREWDPETGLYYYRARYYDPRSAGFISEDPVDFKDGLSRYTYVLANPTNLIDPSGRTPKRMCVGSDCPQDVKDGARDACVGGMSHPDASVRRCIKRRCNPTTKVVCTTDRPCNQGSSPAYTMESQEGVFACTNNPPGPDTCWKKVFIHELWIHVCNPIDPHVDWPEHWGKGPKSLGGYIKRTTRCP
jgi:RHS repeat-associated protein